MNEPNINYPEIYEKQGYIHLRKFIPPFMVDFFKEYLNTQSINGKLEKGDGQVANSECIYGDPAFDTLMLLAKGILSTLTNKDLLPTYTYARIYHNGAELLPHLDRKECEHSVTLSLGGEYKELWPIWVKHPEKDANPILIDLYPGDVLIYKGTEIFHWRDKFLGDKQYQLFMHFVDNAGEYAGQLYDTRPYIGLPANTKK